ncbi:scoloptoxin SSD976-like [Amphibalanus amphitrite]|uniref:scoloptoxin SSD976-like n=1 Tax=Amphibalanus amphitrite TaxID=1232801 RepID=UPI001C91916C|nr:scoloptoxin SSD976-like [Amphibalanus amphitrite]
MGRITHLLSVLLLCVLPALCQHVRHPQHYCRLSQEHQLCNRKPPSSSCGRLLWRGTTLQQRKHVLEMHNVIRSQVARGNVQGFDGFLPPAADMIELEWDDELAEIAQAHVEKCKFLHDCGDCKKTERFHGVGQNLGSAYHFDISEIDKKLKFVIGEWYREVRIYSRRAVDMWRSTNAGHFTQMVWGKTRAIGCGVLARTMIMNNDPVIRTDIFCNYGGVGNVVDHPVYQRGPPCSRCPPGTHCSPVFPGLCAPNRA